MTSLTPDQLARCTGGATQFPLSAEDLALAATQLQIEEFLEWWFHRTMNQS